LDELPTFLSIGMSIQLGEFGTMRLSLSGEGAESPDRFTADNIKGANLSLPPEWT
jgi:hypothetical protein